MTILFNFFVLFNFLDCSVDDIKYRSQEFVIKNFKSCLLYGWQNDFIKLGIIFKPFIAMCTSVYKKKKNSKKSLEKSFGSAIIRNHLFFLGS